MGRLMTFTAGLISVWIIGDLLVVGRSLLMPLVMAVLIWHLLNSVSNGIAKLPLIRRISATWLCRLLAVLVVSLFLRQVIDIVTNNVNEVIAASSRYQENLLNIFNRIDQEFHIKILATVDTFIKGISVQGMLLNFSSVFTSLMGSAVLIVFYVVFLFVEQHFFTQKISAIFALPTHQALVNNILTHLAKDTQTYMGIKTLLSLISAIACWLIMRWIGLDFAEFWALLIFFLNFIPNIGAIVSTAFPALLALIQFDSWVPFLIVTTGIVSIQFIIGNVIEPRYLGKSLNLSPLVILIALALWGAIWGVLGMFLAVPITVMMMIMFAHFETTKPFAVMLSMDGYIQKANEQL